jgi:hypothetical protein
MSFRCLSRDSLTIVGWDAIDASKLGRQFDVARGASLTLEHVTLQNGLASGQGGAARGGAIFNQGSLVLNDVTVQHNSAVASAANEIAAGGGIWSDGSLTVENASTFAFEGNSATSLSSTGGNAYGGAIDIAGGTADIRDSYFGQNTAHSTRAQSYGGALYVGGGTVTMSGDTVGYAPYSGAQGNSSYSWNGGYGGGLYVASGDVTLTHDTFIDNWSRNGLSGGIHIASGANVFIDAFTLAHTEFNSPRNFYGTYKYI